MPSHEKSEIDIHSVYPHVVSEAAYKLFLEKIHVFVITNMTIRNMGLKLGKN